MKFMKNNITRIVLQIGEKKLESLKDGGFLLCVL